MDDLSILPEGVREHVEIMDARNTVNGSWNAIRAELLRLAGENAELREHQDTLRFLYESAASEGDAAREELATSRETIKRLNRRVQVAEAGIAEKVKEASGRNLGRALANAAADMFRHERDEALAELAALKRRIAEAVELRVGDPAWSDGTLAELDGQRVALLPVGGESK